MDNKGDFLAGVLVGGVVGALLGILFAPASGAETRAHLAEKGSEIKDVAAEKARQKAVAMKEASKDLLAQLRERLPRTKEVADVLDRAEEEVSAS